MILVKKQHPLVRVQTRIPNQWKEQLDSMAEKQGVKPAAVYRTVFQFFFDAMDTDCTQEGQHNVTIISDDKN